MKTTLFACMLLPLTASAQRLQATLPPITYHVGLVAAPLFRSADTLRAPSFRLPSLSNVLVVGRFSPELVVVRREGFLYLTPVKRLSDYDPEDANPLPLDPQTQRITYQGVVEVPGASKADLYARAATWVAQTYPASDKAVQKQDAQTGELLIKGRRPVTTHILYEGVLRSSYGGVVHHTLTIYVKDGRYKYILTDLVHDATGIPSLRSGGALEQERTSLYGYVGIGSKSTWNELKVEATRDARHLMAQLQAAMTLKPLAPPASQTPTSKSPSDF